jgi:hypothetical protein
MRLLGLIAITFLYGTLIGHAIHWAAHQPFSRWLYRAHMSHHKAQYPKDDLVSAVYRRSQDDNFFLFGLVVVPALWPLLALVVGLGASPFEFGAVVSLILFVGWLHDHVHVRMHLRTSVVERLFPRAMAHFRRLHAAHHRDMTKNLGIVWFGWDRIFGSFTK